MNRPAAYQILALAMLAAFGAYKYTCTHQPPAVQQHHQRVRQAADSTPWRIGTWVGTDVAVPVQARSVLRPNVLISRRYLDVANGMTAGLLFVHCNDAHHMAGHFPARCYPAQGWVVRSARSREWTVGALKMPCTEYEMLMPPDAQDNAGRAMIIVNCLLRPGGQVLRDMDELTRTIVGAGGQSSGAAQIQIYFDATAPASCRDAAVHDLLEGYKDVISAALAEIR